MRYIPKFKLVLKLPDGSRVSALGRANWTVARVLSEAGVSGKASSRGSVLPQDATLDALGIGPNSVIDLE